MLVKSENLMISKSVLESMDYIDRPFSICEVPVVESGNKYRVDLFSLFNICETQELDKDSIVEEVCNANNISRSDIVGVIPEDKFILSEEFRNFAMNESIEKVVCPLSSKDPVAILGETYDREVEITLDPTCLMEFAGFHESFSSEDEREYERLMASSEIDNIRDRIKQYRAEGKTVKEIKTLFPEHPAFHRGHLYGPTFFHYSENGAKNPEKTRQAIKRYNTTTAVMSHLSDKFDKSHKGTEKDFNRSKLGLMNRLERLKGHVGDENTKIWYNQDLFGNLKGMDKVKFSSHEGMQDEKVQERIEKVSKMVDEEIYPKSWLAKKIAWLRGLYRKFMYKYTIVKDKSISGRIKYVAAFILRVIDKLAKKLQNAVNEGAEYIIDKITDNFVINFNKQLLNEVHDYTPMHGMYTDEPEELNRLGKMINDELGKTFKGMHSAKSEEEFNSNKNLATMPYKHLHGQMVMLKNSTPEGPDRDVLQYEENRLNSFLKHVQYEKYPRSILAKMIHKLRSLYQNIMAKWNNVIVTQSDLKKDNPGKLKFFANIKFTLKRISGKILFIIDKLMQKLQNASDTVVDKVKGAFSKKN